MTYTANDCAELIRHHIVFAEPDPDRVMANLRQLLAAIREMAPAPLDTTAQWLFCDHCGCPVDQNVVARSGNIFTPDGGFYCSECAPADESG